MLWAFLCINVCVVMTAAALRYAGEGLAHAAPVAMAPWVWWLLVAGAGVLGALAVAADRKWPPDRRCRRAIAELLVIFTVFLAFEWGTLPAYRSQYRLMHYLTVVLWLAMVLCLFWRDRRNFHAWGVGMKNFVPAARLLAGPTIVMIAVPLVARQFVGGQIDARRMLIALGTYPLYAVAQLGLFQVFLVPRLRRISDSTASVVLVSAGMFALAHWPNGVVMAACAVPAAVWTLVYLKRPNLYALAISMGLAAAVFANVLPREQVLRNLRTGPIYVQRLIDADNSRAQRR